MNALFDRNKVIVASSDQLTCDLEGEAVILGITAGKYFSLDPVGTRIWELVQTPVRMEQLLAKLMDEYQVDAERCEQEVTQLLQDLSAEGLIEVRSAQAV